jgi:hypothetical protein
VTFFEDTNDVTRVCGLTLALPDILDPNRIASSFEIYVGDAYQRCVADPFQNHAMPYFSRNFCANETSVRRMSRE